MSYKLSAYEQLRLTKIARNEAHLDSLGLTGGFSGSTSTGQQFTQSTALKKKKPKPIIPIDLASVRRSGRNRLEVDYDEKTAYNMLDQAEKRLVSSGPSSSSIAKRRKVGDDDSTTTASSRREVPEFQFGETLTSLSASSSSTSSIPRLMSSSVSLNPPAIIKAMLNQAMPNTGKAEVVNYVSTSSPDVPSNYFDVHSTGVGFNKYSGVLGFSDSVILWVNFNSVDQNLAYANEFLKEGRQFTWFGGSKMTGVSNTTTFASVLVF
jgi:hypothetical protein